LEATGFGSLNSLPGRRSRPNGLWSHRTSRRIRSWSRP